MALHSVQARRMRLCSQMHWRHLCRTLPCSQSDFPPQSRHRLRTLLCSQILPPLHSLHWLLRRSCMQKPMPPHSLHVLRTRLCAQMPGPLHSLQYHLYRLCGQRPDPSHSRQNFFSLPCTHLGTRYLLAAPTRDRDGRHTGYMCVTGIMWTQQYSNALVDLLLFWALLLWALCLHPFFSHGIHHRRTPVPVLPRAHARQPRGHVGTVLSENRFSQTVPRESRVRRPQLRNCFPAGPECPRARRARGLHSKSQHPA